MKCYARTIKSIALETAKPEPTRFERIVVWFCVFITGIMVGYGWAFYHFQVLNP